MGYDEDDPRGPATREALREGRWKLRPGQVPNVKESKRRAGAMPSHFGLKGIKNG